VNKIVIVALVISLTVRWNYHVGRNGRNQRQNALSDYFMQVLSLNKGRQELNQVLSHRLYALDIRILVFFIAVKASNNIFGCLKRLLIPDDLSVDLDMEDEELPRGL